ncbi:exodeoxyribonuclease VII large subunit [Clostridia bacterium]|nr:exodeoxyribonuclease VII large subunit [Clostridia bacterium]
MAEVTYLSVTQVNETAAALFEKSPVMAKAYVRGEVSNFKNHTSGHWYFTLKDSESRLAAVMFKNANSRAEFVPGDGQEICASGEISVFVRDGSYQLYVHKISHVGAGELYEKFLRTKKLLMSEGLFAPERKKPLPPFPKRIAVVTAETGAALRDIQNVISRRCPVSELIIVPTLVQGATAPEAIVASLARADGCGASVIILARGGGSYEDLQGFNAECVARAVAACKTPVVTGVGHETDFTIVDFVSDLRAPTPSASAELITPDLRAYAQSLPALAAQLRSRVTQTIARYRSNTDIFARDIGGKTPSARITSSKNELKACAWRIKSSMDGILAGKARDTNALAGTIEALSPLAVLTRGYSIVSRVDDDGDDDDVGKGLKVVTEPADVARGDKLDIRLRGGSIGAVVTSVGNTAVGNTAVGNTAVGNTAVGNTAVGNTAVGNTAVGNSAVGNSAVGNSAVGNSAGQ